MKDQTDRDLIRELAEALDAARTEMIDSGNWGARDYGWPKACMKVDAALTAARERLAREDQPAAVIEPVCPHGVFPAQACTNQKCAQPAPEPAEPVGVLFRGEGGAFRFGPGDHLLALYAMPPGEHPLYAAPPRPAPVALLSEEEIDAIPMPREPDHYDKIAFGRAIEAEVRRRLAGE